MNSITELQKYSLWTTWNIPECRKLQSENYWLRT